MIELNEQQKEFIKFLLEEEVLDKHSDYDETSKAIASQIIKKLEE